MLLETSTNRSISLISGEYCTGPVLNMQAFSFGQINVPGQRSMFLNVPEMLNVVLTARLDYVFVDEHNRHKRLKGKAVFRAMYTYLRF